MRIGDPPQSRLRPNPNTAPTDGRTLRRQQGNGNLRETSASQEPAPPNGAPQLRRRPGDSNLRGAFQGQQATIAPGTTGLPPGAPTLRRRPGNDHLNTTFNQGGGGSGGPQRHLQGGDTPIHFIPEGIRQPGPSGHYGTIRIGLDIGPQTAGPHTTPSRASSGSIPIGLHPDANPSPGSLSQSLGSDNFFRRIDLPSPSGISQVSSQGAQRYATSSHATGEYFYDKGVQPSPSIVAANPPGMSPIEYTLARLEGRVHPDGTAVQRQPQPSSLRSPEPSKSPELPGSPVPPESPIPPTPSPTGSRFSGSTASSTFSNPIHLRPLTSSSGESEVK